MAQEDSSQQPHSAEDVLRAVPFPLRVAGAWSWRLIVVAVVLLGLVQLFGTLAPVMLPLIIALLIAAPLGRVVVGLEYLKVPRTLGAGLTVLLLVGTVLTLVVLAGSSLVRGFGDLRDQALAGFEEFVGWLGTGPLHLSQEQLDQMVDQVTGFLQNNALGVASGVFGAAGTVGALVAGTIIALLGLFFFLRDGRSMWLWAVKLLPGDSVERMDRAGLNAWITLRRYTQTSAFVATIDAVGIGLGAWILGVPLALPIAVFVFMLSFIPLFGATISGAVAVAVALVDGGFQTAVFMAIIVIVVQAVEGNVLYPWLFGKAAQIHPMVILVAVSSGTLLAGFVGAVIAVPVVAFIHAFVSGFRKEFILPAEPPPISAQIPILRDKSREFLGRAKRKP